MGATAADVIVAKVNVVQNDIFSYTLDDLAAPNQALRGPVPLRRGGSHHDERLPHRFYFCRIFKRQWLVQSPCMHATSTWGFAEFGVVCHWRRQRPLVFGQPQWGYQDTEAKTCSFDMAGAISVRGWQLNL